MERSKIKIPSSQTRVISVFSVETVSLEEAFDEGVAGDGARIAVKPVRSMEEETTSDFEDGSDVSGFGIHNNVGVVEASMSVMSSPVGVVVEVEFVEVRLAFL